jgi:Predicted P-loop-containing kinase
MQDKPMSVVPPVLVIAGLTGSGKTLAIQQLEQLGYTSLERDPACPVIPLVEAMRTHHAALAISLNLHAQEYRDQVPTLAAWVQSQGIPFLFLEARSPVCSTVSAPTPSPSLRGSCRFVGGH